MIIKYNLLKLAFVKLTAFKHVQLKARWMSVETRSRSMPPQ